MGDGQGMGEGPRRDPLLAVLALALAIGVAYLVRDMLMAVFAGLMVAALARNLQGRFGSRLGPNARAILALLVAFVLLTAPLIIIVMLVLNDALALIVAFQDGTAQDTISRALDWTSRTIGWPPDHEREAVAAWMLTQGAEAVTALGERLIALRGPRGVLQVIIAMFVAFYTMRDGHRFVPYLQQILPVSTDRVRRIVAAGDRAIVGTCRGQVLTALIKGGVGGIGMLIAGVPSVALWSFVMAIFTLLPVLTAWMVWGPAALWLVSEGHVWQGLFLVAWGVVITGNIDNLVRPKLIGDRAKIHPVFVLLGVVGGVYAFGFLGVFFGPVLIAVLQSVLKEWNGSGAATTQQMTLFELPEGMGHDGPTAYVDDRDALWQVEAGPPTTWADDWRR